jgi:O-antigen ligase
MDADIQLQRKRITPILYNLISLLIVAFTIFIAVWRILLWEILNPLINANLLRLTTFLQLPIAEITIKWTPIVRFMSIFVILVVVAVLGIKNNYVRKKEFWLLSIPIMGILIVSILSQFWSLNASTTIKRSLFLLAAVLGGIYLGLEFRRSRIILIFELFSVGFVLLSYAMVLVYPMQGIMVYEMPGSWRGFFNYKSFSGVMFAFACIMFLFRFANFRNESWFVRIYSLLFLILSIYFLQNTNNATAAIAFAIVAFVFVLGLLFIKWGRLIRPRQWVFIGILAVAALLAFWLGKDAFLGIFGRSASLTGRVPLWLALVPFIKQRLILGYGFGEVFWYSPYLEEFWKIAPWKAGLAHSGYVEAFLGTGLMGFLFWAAFMVEVGYLSIRYFILERSLYSMIFIVWTIFVLLINITENLLGTYEIFNFLLLVISFSFLVREIISKKQSSLSAA